MPTSLPRRALLACLAAVALVLAGCAVAEPPLGEPTDSPSPAPASSPGPTPAAETADPVVRPTPGGTSPAVTLSPPQASRPVNTGTEQITPLPSTGASGLDHRSPASIHVLVNKRNPLRPADWAPNDLTAPDVPTTRGGLTLRAEAAAAAEELFAGARADGVSLTLISAYRSYRYQQDTYEGWVARHGQAGADRISARPGHSEHQTGLAMDVGAEDGSCALQTCFEDTDAGRWVAEHAVEHGFIIRYPDGAEAVTGYSYEPWHLRYLGTEVAADVVGSGGVLETAWDAAPAPDYS